MNNVRLVTLIMSLIARPLQNRLLVPVGVVSTHDAITVLSGCLDDGPDIDVSTFSTIFA